MTAGSTSTLALATSTGAAIPDAVPVAWALSVSMAVVAPVLVTTAAHLKVQVAPGSRVVVTPSELLTKVAGPHSDPVTVTPVMPTVPVFFSLYVNVTVAPDFTVFGLAVSFRSVAGTEITTMVAVELDRPGVRGRGRGCVRVRADRGCRRGALHVNPGRAPGTMLPNAQLRTWAPAGPVMAQVPSPP